MEMESMSSHGTAQTKVYKYRYVVMAAAAFLQLIQMMFFITYSPVASSTNSYYHSDANDISSALYMASSAVASIPAMYVTQRYGLRPTLYYACLSMLVGSTIRAFAVVSDDTLLKSVFLYVGTLIGGSSNPFAINVSSRVAGVWFADNQRALCTSIVSVSGPAGIMVMSILAPAMVTKPEDIIKLNYTVVGLTLASALVVLVAIRKNEPDLPPSLSHTAHQQPEFWTGLRSCLKSVPFCLMLAIVGGGIGMFNVLYVQMEQILCLRGYSNTFSGMCLVSMIGGGLFGATASGVISDKTRKFTEILKIVFPWLTASLCVFTIVTHYSKYDPGVTLPQVLLILATGSFGFFGLAAYATALELAAECTFPIIETTSAGLLGLVGQIEGILLIVMFGLLGRPIRREQYEVQTCTSTGAELDSLVDPSIALIALSTMGVVMTVVALATISPPYKRMAFEKYRQWAAMQKPGTSTYSGETSDNVGDLHDTD